MTPKTSPEGHDRRDVPRSCRARSPALHVGGRDRVALHGHVHRTRMLICMHNWGSSASAAPSAVIDPSSSLRPSATVVAAAAAAVGARILDHEPPFGVPAIKSTPRRVRPTSAPPVQTPLLSAAAGSVSPASRSPHDAPHPPPPIARCCRARSPSRAGRRRCRGAGLPRGQSLPGILSGGARRPPARRAYPRATLHGCRELEAEEVVAVAVEVAKG